MDAELVGEVFGGTQTPAMARGVTDPYGLAALGPLRPGQLLYYVQKTAPRSLVFTGSKYEIASLPNGELKS